MQIMRQAFPLPLGPPQLLRHNTIHGPAWKVAFKPDGKSDATFEITEIKPTRGVKTVFRVRTYMLFQGRRNAVLAYVIRHFRAYMCACVRACVRASVWFSGLFE